MIGTVTGHRMEDGQLVASIRLSGAADAAPVVERIREGTLKGVSVGPHLLSDCPEFDGKWLAMLLRRPVQLLHFDDAVSGTFGAEALPQALHLLGTLPHPHRAGPDAEAMAQVWLELVQGR
ncbi:hypothetical protein [Rhodobacter capsulatus]|uniref:hypothetical protein n=1 Tax=Rhodobacter capsulatus TaxID=1061 RepID=UPI004024F260